MLYKTKQVNNESIVWELDQEFFDLIDRGRITSIYVNPYDAEEVIVSVAGYHTLEKDSGYNLFFRERSKNGGYGWRKSRLFGIENAGQFSGLLRTLPVYKVTRHPNNPKWIYAGTPVGVFVSEDQGYHWYAANQGPVNVSVEDMFWVGTDLYVATHGLGLYKSTTAETLSADQLVVAPPTEIDPESDCVFVVAVKADQMYSFNGNIWQPVAGLSFPSAYYVKEEGGPDWTALLNDTLSLTKYPLKERSIQIFKPGEMSWFAGFEIWFAWGKSPLKKSGDSYFGKADVATCVAGILAKEKKQIMPRALIKVFDVPSN